MNEESLHLFLELAYQQIEHVIRHYFEVVDADGEEKANESFQAGAVASAMQMKLMSELGMPIPPEEAIAAGSFSTAAIFVDISKAGYDFVLVGEDGWTLSENAQNED